MVKRRRDTTHEELIDQETRKVRIQSTDMDRESIATTIEYTSRRIEHTNERSSHLLVVLVLSCTRWCRCVHCMFRSSLTSSADGRLAAWWACGDGERKRHFRSRVMATGISERACTSAVIRGHSPLSRQSSSRSHGGPSLKLPHVQLPDFECRVTPLTASLLPHTSNRREYTHTAVHSARPCTGRSPTTMCHARRSLKE